MLIADKGCDSDAIRDDPRRRRVEPVIPNRCNPLMQAPVDGFIYALRNRIEHCFNKLKHSRRIATRYDKTSDSVLGFALIGAIRSRIRHFVSSA